MRARACFLTASACLILLQFPQEARAQRDSVILSPGSISQYGSVLSSSDWDRITNKPEWVLDWPSWDQITDKPLTFSPRVHDHDGRYVRKSGGNSPLGKQCHEGEFITGFTMSGNPVCSFLEVAEVTPPTPEPEPEPEEPSPVDPENGAVGALCSNFPVETDGTLSTSGTTIPFNGVGSLEACGNGVMLRITRGGGRLYLDARLGTRNTDHYFGAAGSGIWSEGRNGNALNVSYSGGTFEITPSEPLPYVLYSGNGERPGADDDSGGDPGGGGGDRCDEPYARFLYPECGGGGWPF